MSRGKGSNTYQVKRDNVSIKWKGTKCLSGGNRPSDWLAKRDPLFIRWTGTSVCQVKQDQAIVRGNGAKFLLCWTGLSYLG